MEDPNAPATKGDLAEVRSAMKGDIDEVRSATKGDIDEVRSAMKGDIDEVRSAMKGDIDEVRLAMKGDIAELKQQNELLRSEMHHIYNELVERIADSETKLLKAFYSYAESNQQRLTQIDTEQTGIRNRVGSLEARVLEIEKRLNMPPTA